MCWKGKAHTLYEHLNPNGVKEEDRFEEGLAEWADDGDGGLLDDTAMDEADAQGSLFGSTITLANSAIGAGVLGFPYAFRVSR